MKNLEEICDYVTHFAKEAGLNETETYSVQLAVDEATTNIVEHGYGEECPERIDITCEILDDGLKVVIYDDAAPFTPEAVTSPDTNVSIDEMKPRGLGIYLIHKMMDEVTYESTLNKGNTLTMIKRHAK